MQWGGGTLIENRVSALENATLHCREIQFALKTEVTLAGGSKATILNRQKITDVAQEFIYGNLNGINESKIQGFVYQASSSAGCAAVDSISWGNGTHTLVLWNLATATTTLSYIRMLIFYTD